MSTKPDLLNQEFDLWLTSGSTTIPLQMCSIGYANGHQVAMRDPLNFQRNPVRQSSLKMYNSQQKYSDLEPPWTPIAQLDWSGGKGNKDFDNDNSMYFDGYQVNTMRPGEIILGGKPTTVTFGANVEMGNVAGSGYNCIASDVADQQGGVDEDRMWAHRFTASETIDVKSIVVLLRSSYQPINHVKLYVGIGTVHVDGHPTGITWSTNYFDMNNISSDGQGYLFEIASTSLTAAENYFLCFHSVLPSSGLCYASVYAKDSTTALQAAYNSSDDGSTWDSVGDTYFTKIPYFLMSNVGVKSNQAHLFEYKGAMYYAMQNDDGTSTKLYLNGDQGVCETTDTTTTLINTHSGVATWAENEAVGCVLVLVSGTGSGQPQNWRNIVSNTASDAGPPITTSFTVNPEFDIAPDDTTVFAIVASDKFTEIADFDTNYNVVVTDVLSVNGVVYFACGDAMTLIRMVAYDASGTWTYSWSDHTSASYTAGKAAETGQFTYLLYGADQSGTYIFGAKGGYPATVAKAPVVDYTGFTGSLETLLVFDTAKAVGDQWERITGLERYGESYTGALVALKEGSLYKYREGYWEQIDIREMENTKDRRNGSAHTVKGVYLYFSWHGTVLRYFNGILDRVGPDRAEVAIPTENRAGSFSAMVGYPGMLITAIDAGHDGVSSVIAYNDMGWCELYRGTFGERIQALYVQSIPGNGVDRLWISEGNNIIWIPLSIDPYNHPVDSYNPYLFCTEGSLITSWFYVGLQTVNKLFNSIRLVTEGASSSLPYVTAAYQKDDDTDWTTITGTFDTFSEELDLATTPSVSGKRIRFKLTLYSADLGVATPRIVASVMDCITRLPNKYVTTVTCKLGVSSKDAYTNSLALFNALSTFQDLATPVTVECVVDMLDGVTAFVDGMAPRPLKLHGTNARPEYVVQFSLVEI